MVLRDMYLDVLCRYILFFRDSLSACRLFVFLFYLPYFFYLGIIFISSFYYSFMQIENPSPHPRIS